jgi:hypothetical protein
MYSVAKNYMPEVVSDLPYDFKKMLESCSQVASQPVWQPYPLGILVMVAFLTNMCIVSDQTSEAGNIKCCSELHAGSGLSFVIGLQEDT